MGSKWFARAVPALVIVASIVGAGSAAAAEGDMAMGAERRVVVARLMSAGRAASSVSRVRAYWTRSRMEHAIPLRPSTQPARSASAHGTARGASGTYPAARPAAPLATPDAGHTGVRGADSEYYWPADQYDVPPALTSGKLFLTWKGKNYVCSATVVNSPRRSLVWTAGHCVADRMRWASRMMFCPAYLDGTCPEGRWTVRKRFTTSAWFHKANFSYDFGALLMRPLHGQKIVDAVGGQGFAWGKPRRTSWTVLGYPAAPPFDGQQLYACEDATKRFLDPPRPGPDQTGIDCGMTAGSSGGGWLTSLGSDGLGFVNGVVSLGIDAADEIFSPYHGRVARRLWRQAGS